MMRKTSADISTRSKVLISLLGATQVGLLGAAHWDMSHRDADELRGSKGMWRAITLIGFVGPVCYFVRGRK